MAALALLGCTVDLDAAEARWPGRVERLTATEVRLLRYLHESPGVALDKATLLREVWGYKPGVASRTVDTTVQRLRLKVEAEPDAPRHLLTVYGVGYRWVPADPAAVERAPDGFVGRAEELARLDRLTGACLLTLVGPGGAGKSRLARRAAERARGGAVVVPLGGVNRLDAAVDRVAAELGIPLTESSEAGAIDQIRRVLIVRGCMLVLDDLEAGAGLDPAVEIWATHARVLVTAPVPLGLANEEVLALPPLTSQEAAELFFARARLAGAEGVDAKDPAVEQLIRALEGSPLAIELAAARVALLSPAELLERLARPLDVLRSQSQPARHRSLRAALEGGWHALGADERGLLQAAALFPSAFRAADVEEVSGSPEDETLTALEGLVRSGWVQRVPGRVPARFQLLSSVRAYALEQGRERAAAEARLRGWAVRLAEQLAVEIEGPRAAEAMRRATEDWPNLSAAVDTGPELPEAARIGVGLGRYAAWTRRFREGLHLLRGAPWPGASAPLQVRGYATRLRLGNAMGRDPAPEIAAAEGLLPDAGGAARAAYFLADGVVSVRAGRYAEARHRFDEAARLAEAAGEVRNAGAARVEASIVARASGDPNGALALLDAAQAPLFAAEATRDLALLESQRGVVLAALGRRVEAESAYRRALVGLDQVGDITSGEVTRGNLANLLLLDDRVEEAERLLRRVVQSARESGNRPSEAHYRMGLGGVASARGRPAEALDAFEEARLLFAATGFRFPAAVCRGLIGRLLHGEGNLEGAGVAYRAAEHELRTVGRTRAAARIAALASLAAGDRPSFEAAIAALGEDVSVPVLRVLGADPDGRTPEGVEARRVLSDTRDRRLLPE